MEIAGAVVAEQAISTTAEASAMAAVAVPTLPLKATFERFATAGAQTEVFYRKTHSLTIVFGRAYIFGGVETSPDRPTISAKPTDASLRQTTTTEKFCSADMHILTLPQFLHSPGVPEYQVIPPLPKDKDGEVPSPRKNHLVAVDGDDLVVFGGKNSKGEKIAEDEVWRFNTNTLSWRRERDQIKAAAIAIRSGFDIKTDTRTSIINEYEYKVEHAQDGFASIVSWRKLGSTDQEPGEGPEWAAKQLPKNPLAPGPAARTQDTESAPAGAISSDITTTTNPDNDYIIPLTTGQGRNYLAFLFTLSAPDIWALQVHSAPSSLTSLKDKMRNWMDWDSGFLSWAKVEIQIKDVEVANATEADGKSLPGRMQDYAVERVNLGGKPGAECMIVGGVDAAGRGVGEVWTVRFD